ncbi:S-layer homology domain-containing protein [Paenibacillus sp. IB182493]|uniref:S-layer homology domain-containing protein n=2 Tax=Paenibacillus arenilitoris TaxID=2772299 RepID=A0A927CI89_9BACL|nr:S-layer homology domain-containing protein [Paenibacillus arenilitoris]
MATAAAVFAAGLLAQGTSADNRLPFHDISNSYARNEIIDLYNKKIIAGTSASSFSPTRSMTRAEFITAMDRLLKLEPVASPVSPYADVAKNAWYYGWIQAAVQLELASGTSATTFAPAKPVTRQEAAVMLAKALKQTGNAAANVITYKDKGQIADWAIPSVAAVHALGLMKGDRSGTFRPTDPMTRQEAASLLARVLKQDGWEAELKAKPNERIAMGWQYGQTTAQYKSTIVKSNVNTLSPRWYFVGSTGAVSDSTDAALVAWANNNGKKIWAMVGNRSDQEATHQLLSSSLARTTAVTQLAARVSQYGIDGLNIDFENVAPADRSAFTKFITQLAAKLHAMGKVLSVDVSPDLGTDWTEAFDYAELGKQADYMVLMGYDEHYGGSLYPGPNASLPYVQKAVKTILKSVSGKKVILALPFYNRDWSLKANGTAASSAFVTLTEQNRLLGSYSLKPKWDASLGQYVVSYSKQSIKHMIWIEDGRSLIAKYNLAVKHGLAGVAYWYIGGESPDIWTSMRNAAKYYDYSFKK